MYRFLWKNNPDYKCLARLQVDHMRCIYTVSVATPATT